MPRVYPAQRDRPALKAARDCLGPLENPARRGKLVCLGSLVLLVAMVCLVSVVYPAHLALREIRGRMESRVKLASPVLKA